MVTSTTPVLTPEYAPFPPSAPSVLTTAIPSYLYVQYKDDDALQAFILAYNAMAQEYVDSFVGINLPCYNQPQISGQLLDLVGAGLYGLPRPPLSSGKNHTAGPYNTRMFNQPLPYNGIKIIGPSNVVITDDDTYKRIITWHVFKGDGDYFNIAWLKRRVARFLFGANGNDPPVDQTYRIGVTIAGTVVTITLFNSVTSLTGYMGFGLNPYNGRRGKPLPYNGMKAVKTTSTTPLPFADKLTQAIQTGDLELPFQFTYNVIVQS